MADEKKVLSPEMKFAKGVAHKVWLTVKIAVALFSLLCLARVISAGPAGVLGTSESRWWYGVWLVACFIPYAAIFGLEKWVMWVVRNKSE